MNEMSDREVVYLDHHATTPTDSRVADKVMRVLNHIYGNPSSKHQLGEEAKEIVERARAAIASHLGALPGEIIFTSGASESNNIAIQGLMRGAAEAGTSRHKIVTSNIEHKSVSKTAKKAAERYGYEYRRIPVSSHGIVKLEEAEDLIDDETLLVSVQAVNNELGTIQPIEDIVHAANSHGAFVHCDAAQALGRLSIEVDNWDIDLMSLSAHKAYGPKGIGVLYIEGGTEQYPIQSITFGGGHEDGLRPGTVNVPAVAGFGKACQIIEGSLLGERKRCKRLRDRFEEELLSRVPEGEVLGDRSCRVTTTTNVYFPDVEAEAVLARTREVAASTGSACEAGAPEPSRVLQAIGLARDEAYRCIRFAVGRFTTEEEVDIAAQAIAESAREIYSITA